MSFTIDVQHVQDVIIQEIANIMWAYAKLEFDPGQSLCAAAAHRLLRVVHRATPQNLANLLWAYAKLAQSPGDECMQALTSRLQQQAQNADPQVVANTLWACAEVAWAPSDAFMEAMFARMLQVMPTASAQALANLLSACVKLGMHPEGKLVQAAVRRMHDLMQARETSSQNLSNMVWACAKMGVHPAGGFTPACIKQLQDSMSSAASQQITTTSGAYATLQEPLPAALLEAAAQRLQVLLPHLKVQGMCRIAVAYACYRHIPGDGFLDCLALQFQQLQPPAATRGVAEMRRAYKSLDLQPDVAWLRPC